MVVSLFLSLSLSSSAEMAFERAIPRRMSWRFFNQASAVLKPMSTLIYASVVIKLLSKQL
jgi:hypothetical protein